jgi:hypothetical protein
MPQKRRTLGDRNRASIALDPTPELEPSAEPRSSAQPNPTPTPGKAPQKPRTTPSTGSTARTPAPARKAATAAASDTARLGIYLTPEEFDDAKAGYLADWSNGGEADTFGKWIAAAIEAYAARTPKQRAAAPPRGRAEERTGATRSFAVPSDTVARMRAAITADQKADRWPSDSAWCGEAIAAAVDQARDQNGGSLPTPPPRLPNRLAR